jgi:hypothetical protein
VIDAEVQWAGAPDIVLQLSQLAGGTALALSVVQVGRCALHAARCALRPETLAPEAYLRPLLPQFRALLRVTVPVSEDPPYVRRIALCLLDRPYLDFDLRALGAADIMSLPAVSGWLRSTVGALALDRLVAPAQLAFQLALPGGGEGVDGGAPLPPPLGLLTLEVVGAEELGHRWVRPASGRFLNGCEGRLRASGSGRAVVALGVVGGPPGLPAGPA